MDLWIRKLGDKMEIFDYDHKTSESKNIALSQDEVEAREIKYANWLAAKEAKEAEQAAAKAAAEAKLAALGLTTEDLKAVGL